MFGGQSAQPCQEDLISRMDRDKGSLLELSERLLLFSRLPLTVEERPRRHFSALGNTRGNTLGPIRLPDWTNKDETWIATVALKDKIFEGAKFGVGGISDQGPVDTPVVRQKTDTEPVFWHARAPSIHEEVLHTLKVVGTLGAQFVRRGAFESAFGAFAFWLRLHFVRLGCVCVLRFGCVLKRVYVLVAFWFAF